MARSQDERSLGELFGELSRETGVIVRKEVELASTEMTAKARTAAGHVGTIAAGGALAHAGLLVALATMGLGYALVSKGRANLSRANLAPTQTIETLKETATWQTRTPA